MSKPNEYDARDEARIEKILVKEGLEKIEKKEIEETVLDIFKERLLVEITKWHQDKFGFEIGCNNDCTQELFEIIFGREEVESMTRETLNKLLAGK